jgi:GT2 family glycosyltransferase
LISVIIVNWNHKHYLEKCLDALSHQVVKGFEICIVDNGSTDGSDKWISENYPEVKWWSFPDNQGFSKAFNWGVNQTQGEFLISLNPDVFVEREFIQKIIIPMDEDDRVGIVSPKLLRFEDPGVIDSTGLFIDRFRRPFDRGQGEIDKGQYDQSLTIFGACGAAALYRRAMLVDTAVNGEFFDEDFFAYYEDADLAWRAQLRGWKARYAPKAVASHIRGWGDTLRKNKGTSQEISGPRLALRNRWLMTLKNDSLKYFLLDLPFILVKELSRLLYTAIFKPGAILGLKDLIIGSKKALAKRKYILGNRVIHDSIIRTWFTSQKIKSEEFK